MIFTLDVVALIVPNELLEKIANTMSEQDHLVGELAYDIFDVAQSKGMEDTWNFTGEINKVLPDGSYPYNEYTSTLADNEVIIYEPLSKSFDNLLKAPYSSMQECVDELKQRQISQLLPQDFDFADHLYHIVGSYTE